MLLLSWLVSFCFAVLLCLSSVGYLTAARWARGMDGKEVSSFVAVAYSIFSDDVDSISSFISGCWMDASVPILTKAVVTVVGKRWICPS